MLAQSGPARAASLSFTDLRGTVLTVTDFGTINFLCRGMEQFFHGDEGYVICADGQTLFARDSFGGGISPGSVSLFSPPTSPTLVPLGKTITIQATSFALGGALGIHTFVTWMAGSCEFLICQKLFNRSGKVIRLTHYKRCGDVDADGTFDFDFFYGGPSQTSVRATDTDNPGANTTVELVAVGNVAGSQVRAYHNEFHLPECETCTPQPGATRAPTAYDGVLVAWFSFTGTFPGLQPPPQGMKPGPAQGFVPLQPKGKAGSEKFLCVIWRAF